tara:strand:+ start:10676 stop:11140 length:465 start_codon:yes stop_codon:yes gene_type:complete
MAYNDNNFSIANSQNVPAGTFGISQTDNPFSVGTNAGMNNTPANNPFSIGNSPNLISRGVDEFSQRIMPTSNFSMPGINPSTDDGTNWDKVMTGVSEALSNYRFPSPSAAQRQVQKANPINTRTDFLSPPQRGGLLQELMMKNYMQNKNMRGLG